MSKAKEAAKGLFKGSTWKKAVKEPQSNWSEAIAQTVVDTGMGVAGGAAGNFLGPWSLLGAIPINIWANKSGHRWARAASIAMISAGIEETASSSRTAAGTGFNLKDEYQVGSERVKSYFGQMKRKFGLEKLFPSSSTSSSDTTDETQTTNGLGTATFDSLDKHEREIVSDAIEHEAGGGKAFESSPSARTEKSDVVEAFTVSGLDDLDTPHVI